MATWVLTREKGILRYSQSPKLRHWPLTSTVFFVTHNFLGFTTRDVTQKGKLLSLMSFRQIIIKIWALIILYANFRSVVFQSKKCRR
jgi:hypothetical protein